MFFKLCTPIQFPFMLLGNILSRKWLNTKLIEWKKNKSMFQYMDNTMQS